MSKPEVWNWLAVAGYLGLNSVVLAVVTYLYFKHVHPSEQRKKKEIAARVPELLLCGLLVSAVQLIAASLDLVISSTRSGRFALARYQLDLACVCFFAAMMCSLALRMECQYQIGKMEMSRVWKSELNLRVHRSKVLMLHPMLRNKRTLIITCFSASIILAGVISILEYSLISFLSRRTLIFAGECLVTALVCIVLTDVLMNTVSIIDQFGIRHEMKLMTIGVIGWCLIGSMIHFTLPLWSFSYSLAYHCRNSLFIVVYYGLTMYRVCPESLSLRAMLRRSIEDENAVDRQGYSSALPMSSMLLTQVFCNYDSFVLLTEHCVSEMSVEGILFIVWYMRAKQLLFVFLRDHNLFDEQKAREHQARQSPESDKTNASDSEFSVSKRRPQKRRPSSTNSYRTSNAIEDFDCDDAFLQQFYISKQMNMHMRRSKMKSKRTQIKDAVMSLSISRSSRKNRRQRGGGETAGSKRTQSVKSAVQLGSYSSRSGKSRRPLHNKLKRRPLVMSLVQDPEPSLNSAELTVPSSTFDTRTGRLGNEIEAIREWEEMSPTKDATSLGTRTSNQSVSTMQSDQHELIVSDTDECDSNPLDRSPPIVEEDEQSQKPQRKTLESLFGFPRGNGSLASPSIDLDSPQPERSGQRKYFREIGTVVTLPVKVLRVGVVIQDKDCLDEVIRVLQHIFEDFIEDESVHSVNVSNDARVAALKMKAKLGHSQSLSKQLKLVMTTLLCLDRVLSEVTRVIKNDILFRFRDTPAFQKWYQS